MVHFIGAGPGAPDLITIWGAELLRAADVVIYAGSLVNPALLEYAKPGCEVRDSAEMTLEELVGVMAAAERAGKTTVRLHSGDPCLYGAIREQTDALDQLGVAWDITPGVSSFCGAAAALGTEYTSPGVSQSLILTRAPGRTPVPDGESLRAFAAHGASMVLFLSCGELDAVQAELLYGGGYTSATPAAIVYKATWRDEIVLRCTLGTLAESGRRAGIRKTALILVGDFLGASGERSKLYDPGFATEYRSAVMESGAERHDGEENTGE
ncbi:MAG: precorrin-4 C(11)-methyltransferase [Oscillibacter sp.]|nr:precorrin-4 C(11)-methyltransferase [Oscillibacter sp.]